MNPTDWTVGGMDPQTRLMEQTASQRWKHPDVEVPSPAQVAMVLHALADHTALEQARTWDRREGDDGFCPTSRSVGRWLHQLGDLIDDRAVGLRPPPRTSRASGLTDPHWTKRLIDQPLGRHMLFVGFGGGIVKHLSEQHGASAESTAAGIRLHAELHGATLTESGRDIAIWPEGPLVHQVPAGERA